MINQAIYPYGKGDNSYQTAGAYEGIKKLVDAFYEQMDSLPEAAVIRAMHPEDLTVAREKLCLFLCGWLGGPKLFKEKYGANISIPKFHQQFPIGIAERDAWLLCMKVAAEEQPFPEDFKRYLLEQLFVPAERSRSQT